MFVRNSTSLPVELPRGHFRDGVFVAALVAAVPFRLTQTGLSPWEGPRKSLASAPGSMTEQALWEGASLTVSGTVLGPGRATQSARVTLRVGDFEKTVLATGDRRWVRNGGKLIPSVPAPWEELPLSWERAFGGTMELKPGPFGRDRLPHPGGRFPYPQNPVGRGVCIEESGAEGKELPNFESPDHRMVRPIDQPPPAGLSPCPDLSGLRVPTGMTAADAKDRWALLRMILRMAHPAAGDQIFPRLPPGTAVGITGVRNGPFRFQVPTCPFQVGVRKGRATTRIEATVRNIHVGVDDGLILVTYGHGFYYKTPPSWVEVTEKE